jgi:hypothetical protein
MTEPDNREKARDRRIAWGAAVMALAGAPIGSGLGVISTIAAINAQHNDYVWTQRQAMYAQFVDDIDKINREILTGRQMRPAPIATAQAAALSNGLDAMSTDYAEVQLLGNDEVIHASILAAMDLEKMADELIEQSCKETPDPEVTYCSLHVAGDAVSYYSYLHHRTAFVDAMRDDLGLT